MQKRYPYVYLLILVLLLWTTSAIHAQFFNEPGLKITKLYDWIDNNYVDSVDLNKLNEELIKQLLQKMDPHSTYISKNDVSTLNEQLQGNFDGIGITFSTINDTVVIINVTKDGPSFKAGIKRGDRIVKIGNDNIAGMGSNSKKIYSKLRGKKGTEIIIGIKRPGSNDLLTFNIIRDKIPIQSVDAAYSINDETGYIRLERFSATTNSELKTILAKFKSQKIKNIILDLSDNGGGYFDVAVNLVDEFLSSKKLIVYTKGFHSEKKEYFSTDIGSFENGKLVVIINEGSASASEIVAGAIQDWDRGVIIGRRSFGKGLVQRQFSFPDTSMLRLTIARYYTPSGRLIQKPYNKGYKEYTDDLSNRINNGELMGKETFSTTDSIKYLTLEKKRPVYGGGGIIPDIFVPLDTTGFSPYFIKLKSNSIISNFAVEYTDKNRNEFQTTFSDFQYFKNHFEISGKILDSLIKYADKHTIKYKEDEFKKAKPLITIQLKAYMAKDLWSQSEFYEIYNESNKCFNKALEVLKHYNKYQIEK